MRCPYCGERNPDTMHYCVRCGRDLRIGTQARQGQRPFQPTQGTPAPTNMRPSQPPRYANASPPPPQPRPAPQQQPAPARNSPRRRAPSTNDAAPEAILPPVVSVREGPEPPIPFPPQTLDELKSLEKEGLDYAVVHDDLGYGRKKIVRIAFRPSVPWLQIATLLKALSAYRSSQFDTIVVQGTFSQAPDVYDFTNGQLQYDHHTRLGSQLVDRYLIDSGTGLESDAVRIVFTERS